MLEYKRDIYDEIVEFIIVNPASPFRALVWLVTGEWMNGKGPFTPHTYER